MKIVFPLANKDKPTTIKQFPLAKNILITLGLTRTAAADPEVQEKVPCGKGKNSKEVRTNFKRYE